MYVPTRVAARRVDYAFRFARAARSVEYVERMLRIERLGFAFVGSMRP